MSFFRHRNSGGKKRTDGKVLFSVQETNYIRLSMKYVLFIGCDLLAYPLLLVLYVGKRAFIKMKAAF